MPEFTKFGFSAGVMSKRFHMRSDIQQYDLGLASAENFLVDFAGGLISRPGMEFLEYIQDDDEPVRLTKFQFNNLVSNTYVIVFSKDRVRFMQDGTYVLEAAQTITGTTSTTATLVAHGYVNADWVKIAGETYEITNATANTFDLIDPFGDVVNPSTLPSMSVQRIYTWPSPYATADLRSLKFSQHRDTIYINSVGYTERKLVRRDHADWAFYRTIVTPTTNFSPKNLTLTPDAAGTAGVAYVVTAIDVNGKESSVDPTAMTLTRLSVNFVVTAGSVKLTWTAPGVPIKKYKIYRTQVMRIGADVHFGLTFGYIGESLTTQFTDNNIVADFTNVILEEQNPFALRSIDQITITAGGTGYNDNTTTVTATGAPGSGFTGKPIIIGGAIKGVRILTHGIEYVSPTIAFPTGGGTGATATATVNEGGRPNCSIMAQQRRVRFGSNTSPGLIAGSRIADYDNYNTSGFGLATDPYLVVLDSEQPTPILNAIASPEGMFIFQSTGIAQVRGVDDGVISPNSIRQHTISNEGADDIQPKELGREFLYLNSTRDAFAVIQPTNLPTYYSTKDISIFADDYFLNENPVIAFDWARSPDRIIWAVREDGSFLAGTYNVDQEVSAWIEQKTFGAVEDVVVIEEDNKSNAYFITKRTYNPTPGTNDVFDFVPKRYIERIKPHTGTTPEDFPNLDSYQKTEFTLAPFAMWLEQIGPPNYTTGLATYTMHSNGGFIAGDVGKIVRAGKFRGEITAYTNADTVTVQADRLFVLGTGESMLFSLPSFPYFEANTWSKTAKFTGLQGLKRFMGRGFGIKVEGEPATTTVSDDGTLTLGASVSHAVVGFKYEANFTTLYLTANDVSIEGKRKAVKSIRVRLVDSDNNNVQIKAVDGTSEYVLSNRVENTLFDDTGLKDGMFDISLDGGVDFGGQIFGKVTNGAQVSIIGYSAEVDLEP